MYFQNLSIGVLGFWLAVSIILATLISLLIRLFFRFAFKKDLKLRPWILIISSLLFLIFLVLIITDRPYLGGR